MARVKIDDDLYRKIRKCAELAGYSSPEEFITHVLEKALDPLDDENSDDEIRKQLRGLGYIS